LSGGRYWERVGGSRIAEAVNLLRHRNSLRFRIAQARTAGDMFTVEQLTAELKNEMDEDKELVLMRLRSNLHRNGGRVLPTNRSTLLAKLDDK